MRKLRLEIVMMAVGLTLMLAVPAKAAIIGDPVSYNGHTYYLLDGKPWVNQEAEAVTLGGHLVTINDVAENTWLWDTFGIDGTGLFFGFNDVAIEDTFVWSSGEPVTFTNWRFGEPNNVDGNEDFGELGSDYKWNDVSPLHTWRAVAEVVPNAVPEPSTFLLIGSGLTGLVVMRRRRKK